MPARLPTGAPPEIVQRMEYPNADVLSVLRFYEQLTGKRLVIDNTVQGQVNIVVNTPMTREEAIKIIELNLILNGFSLVPAEGDIIKVIGSSKNPRTAGVPIITTPEALPEGDRVVSYLFKLRHADPTELANTLNSYIAAQVWTSVVPLQSSQSLLVTESTSIIRNLMKVIEAVDIPPAEVVSEFIPLRQADATDVLEKLQAIFQSDSSQTTSTAARPRTPQPAQQPGQPNAPAAPPSVEINAGTLTEDSIIVGKIRLTADVRTNRIHVVTRPVNMPFIRTLIEEFDSDVQFGEPARRELKFISAGDVLPVVVQAITEPGAEAPQVEAGQRTGAGQPAAGGGATTSTSAGGTFTVSEGLSTEPVDTTPQAVTVGNAKIIADKRANAIIVLGNAEVKNKVFQVIDEIDVRAPQVLLNTVIGELSLTDDQEFGIDYLYHSVTQAQQLDANGNPITTGARDAFAGIARSTGAPLIDASSFRNAAAFATAGTGLSAFIAPTDSLQIIVTALESTSRFRVTSRPMVFTSNNKKAIIASGQEIAVPVSTVSTFDASPTVPTTQSSIQFKTVALQLEVVPLINADREVSLDILQKVDNVSGTSTIDGNQIPIISTRYIRTNVSVANRGTVILGGLITKNDEKGYTGLPLLSRLPLIGPLFRTTTKSNQRTELIVLMRPIVTWEPQENVPVREREEERLIIEPDLDSTLDPTGRHPVRPESALLRQPAAPLRETAVPPAR